MADINNLVDGLFKSIDSKNTDAFASYLAEDAVFTMGDTPAVSGKDNIHTGVGQFFESIKGLSHTVKNTILNGNDLVTPGTVTYTRHDDSELTVSFCNVFKLEDDKIKDYKVYIDLSQLYK
ncbi:MAG: nuclear transport factor 2 family protein [Candidatus Kapaibacterium sp.]